MSERTFRAVVASVLVGALVLAIAVVVVVLPNPATPEPAVAPTSSQAVTAAPTSTPVPSAPVAWAAASLTGVGDIPQGSASASAFVLDLIELRADAVPDAPGSVQLTLTDAAGNPSLAFVGTPSVVAPGSLGVVTRLTAPNVLLVRIVASDVYNVEPITIRGLTIRAGASAALGPATLELGKFEGSLAGGTTGAALPPVGTVVPAR